jgi:type IV pilus assembly protein PilC
MMKIVPSFEKIFKDFGTTLPAMTTALIQISAASVHLWFLFFPLYLLALLVLIHVTLRYLGWTEADMPGTEWFTRRLDSAQILDTLSLVAAQRRPLPEGIASLARSYPKKNIRRRLREALADIEMGRDWCESLLWQGLIRRPELAILQAAQRAGNLAWMLREMADSGRRRLAYRVQAVSQAILPPIVIVMGLVVMFIVVALFMPLVALIQKLT